MYFDWPLCHLHFRQKGHVVVRQVRVVAFQDFFAVFTDQAGKKRQLRQLKAEAHLSHLRFVFFFKELELINAGRAGRMDAIHFRVYDIEFKLQCVRRSSDSGTQCHPVEQAKLQDLFQHRCVHHNLLCELYPHESTFPPRTDCLGRLYINAAEYFDDLAHAIKGAHHSVMITDWCFTPFIYLQRPHGRRDPTSKLTSEARATGLDPAFRLDNLLKAKAEDGVHIYIILFKELSLVLDLKSEAAEAHMRKLHKNIHVIRHCPTKLFDRTGVSKSWTHHQKFVVVDNTVAFVGGIDLCSGRFDTHRHPLFDPLPPYLFPADDYLNPQVETTCNRLFKEEPWPPISDLSVFPLLFLCSCDLSSIRTLVIIFFYLWFDHLDHLFLSLLVCRYPRPDARFVRAVTGGHHQTRTTEAAKRFVFVEEPCWSKVERR